MPDVRSGRIDLHAHSNYSDGKLSPEALVEEAQWRGLAALALTDHDNVDGLEPFRAAGIARGVETVPGVELSCVHEDIEVHVVGLFLERVDGMRETLLRVRHGRAHRMEAMLEKLRDIGIEIRIEDIPQEAGKSIGRPHLARALVAMGAVRNTAEAFGRYIGDDGPAYVPKARLTVADGIRLIREAGGVSVLAHPGFSDLVSCIEEFAELGIDAAEAYYPKHTPDVTARILAACEASNLLVSGGSDFHAPGEGADLGVPRIEYGILDALRERLNVRQG